MFSEIRSADEADHYSKSEIIKIILCLFFINFNVLFKFIYLFIFFLAIVLPTLTDVNYFTHLSDKESLKIWLSIVFLESLDIL